MKWRFLKLCGLWLSALAPLMVNAADTILVEPRYLRDDLRSCAAALIAAQGSLVAGVSARAPVIVLVNKYSSMADITGHLASLKEAAPELRVVHVHSRWPIPKALKGSFNPTGIDVDLRVESGESFPDALRRISQAILAEGQPVAVIPSVEPGVVLGNHLARILGRVPGQSLPYNSRPRRWVHKGQMARAFRPDLAAPTLEARSAQEALQWVQDQGFLYKDNRGVFVKPAESAASDLGAACFNCGQIASQVEAVLTGMSVFEIPNRSAIVQPLVGGDEHAVDAVTLFYEGRFYTIITGIWRYGKVAEKQEDGRSLPLYHVDQLVDPWKEDDTARLVAMHQAAIEDLNLRVGITHGEFKDKIIEIAQRPAGSFIPWIEAHSTSEDPFVLDLEARLAPEKFLARFSQPGRSTQNLVAGDHTVMVYRRTKHTGLVELKARPGIVQLRDDQIQRLRSLPGVIRFTFSYEHGQVSTPTKDLLSRLGLVVVAHENKETFQTTLDEVVAMDNNGYFYQGPN